MIPDNYCIIQEISNRFFLERKYSLNEIKEVRFEPGKGNETKYFKNSGPRELQYFYKDLFL